ncbi:MAG TPA: oligoribonuclease [Candidatus Saccharimonadales bacterium]|jgi:oligoribonuclease
MKVLPTKLLWIDLEMTGLDPEKDRILEVGAIVTSFDFNEEASYEAVVRQPERILSRMKKSPLYDWSSGRRKVQSTVYEMHKANGLLDKITEEGKAEKQVEQELLDLVDSHFTGAVYLAGNSIHQDRRFIRKWWPNLEDKLHYRMLDVSSFKVYMQGRSQLDYHQPDSHRALEGIRGSIKELKYYTKKIKD